MSFLKTWNIPLLVVVVLLTAAVCSITVGAAWKFIHPFAGGVLAGWESLVLVLVCYIYYKHRNS